MSGDRQAPPGWYADPWRQASLRWWDGAAWTPQLSGGAARVQRPRLPAGAPIYGWPIWVIALLPLLGGILPWLMHFDFGPYVVQLQSIVDQEQRGLPPAQPVMLNPYALYTPLDWAIMGLGLLLVAANAVLAHLDQTRLRGLGVVRPFPWGWAFLTPVYAIGRSVIVRRVASPMGFAPAIVAIVCSLVAVLSAFAWSLVFAVQLFGQLAQTTMSAT